MPYHAFSTPAALGNIRTSPGTSRHIPDHAYSPLFTTGILNSSHPFEHGRTSQHLTFRQEVQTTPRKTAVKPGLPSPLSTTTGSPSMKKKQSSASLSRSLASSQSGSIKTPKKMTSERDVKASTKPKIDWWRGRSTSYVSAKEPAKDDKLQGSRTGWLRQSDVWMTPEGLATERIAISRTDGLPAPPSYRPLPIVPFPKEHIPLSQHENPVIKKKSSLGTFRFRNFFQPGKAKEAARRVEPELSIQPSALYSANRANQSVLPAVTSDPYSASYPQTYRSNVRPQLQNHSLRNDTRPRRPLITTSTARFSNYPTPYSIDPSLDSSHSVLPYMSGAGDGWDTPFPDGSHTYSSQPGDTAFPFPPAAPRMANARAMEQLAVSDEAMRHERAPSAAFEYQEFETSLRNSGQLSIVHGSGDSIGESDKENRATYASTISPDNLKSQSSRVGNIDRQPTSRADSEFLRIPRSVEYHPRQPLVETVKPLSIGRNYPRSRPFAPADTNSHIARPASNFRPMEAKARQAVRRGTQGAEENPDGKRSTWDLNQEFAELGIESLGDAAEAVHDSPGW